MTVKFTREDDDSSLWAFEQAAGLIGIGITRNKETEGPARQLAVMNVFLSEVMASLGIEDIVECYAEQIKEERNRG